jgi:hypothetical protein
MKRSSLLRADAALAGALFLIALTAIIPAGVLYWLMQPTVIANPGLTAYRAPKPDPVVGNVQGGVRHSYALSLAAAKRENELLHAESRSALAAAQDRNPTPEGSSNIGQQKRQRRTRTQARQSPSVPVYQPAAPVWSWEFGTTGFATYR